MTPPKGSCFCRIAIVYINSVTTRGAGWWLAPSGQSVCTVQSCRGSGLIKVTLESKSAMHVQSTIRETTFRILKGQMNRKTEETKGKGKEDGRSGENTQTRLHPLLHHSRHWTRRGKKRKKAHGQSRVFPAPFNSCFSRRTRKVVS